MESAPTEKKFDFNPPLVIHVEDDRAMQLGVEELCEEVKVNYVHAKNYVSVGTIIREARDKAIEVLAIVDLNTKHVYGIDGDTMVGSIKVATRPGIEKTPVVIHTGDSERGEAVKRSLKNKHPEDLGILHVVCKMDRAQLVAILDAHKKGRLKEAITVFERRRISSTSPQGNPGKTDDRQVDV